MADGVARPGYSSYAQLEALLAQGWRIEPPIYARPRWRAGAPQENNYHLILWRGEKVSLISVADSPQMREFLAEQGLAVDRL